MLKYFYIFILLYHTNIVLNSFVNLMIANITAFNYKIGTNYTNIKFFFDTFFSFYINNNKFSKLLINFVGKIV
jgi:hypothetical protein